MISIEAVNAMVEEATQSLPGSVRADTELASLDGWDSMGLVILIDVVRGQTGADLAVHDLRACATPVEVLALVRQQAGA